MTNGLFLVIAVDGGAASGKSSTAQGIAKKLHFMHVDTGQHYRLLSYLLLKNDIAPMHLSRLSPFLKEINLKTDLLHGKAYLQASSYENIGLEELRSESVNACVSQYSAVPEIRSFLLNYQRELISFAKDHHFHGVVMEGRDVGTTILPYADFKFFLYADLETRTKRRALQGHQDSIARRDTIDSNRVASPLLCAEDAMKIDNSNLSLEAVIDIICQHIQSQIL